MKNIFKHFALRIVLPMLLLSVIVLCSNCSKFAKKNDYPHDYSVYLNIRDVEGKDILKEIPLENFRSPTTGIVYDKDGGYGELASDSYQLYTDASFHELESEKWYDGRKLSTSVLKLDNRFYLYIWINSFLDLEKITFRFTCSSIFGDDKEHIIDSYWRVGSWKPNVVDTWRSDGSFVPASDIWVRPDNSYDKGYHRRECYRMMIDGKEYEAEQKTFVSNHDEKRQNEYLKDHGKRETADLASVVWIVLNE